MNLTIVIFILDQLAEAAAVLSGTIKTYVSPPLHFKVNHRRRKLVLTVEDDD